MKQKDQIANELKRLKSKRKLTDKDIDEFYEFIYARTMYFDFMIDPWESKIFAEIYMASSTKEDRHCSGYYYTREGYETSFSWVNPSKITRVPDDIARKVLSSFKNGSRIITLELDPFTGEKGNMYKNGEENLKKLMEYTCESFRNGFAKYEFIDKESVDKLKKMKKKIMSYKFETIDDIKLHIKELEEFNDYTIDMLEFILKPVIGVVPPVVNGEIGIRMYELFVIFKETINAIKKGKL